MRNGEKTYKHWMAFSDDDRKSDLHNDACLYLAEKENMARLLKLVAAEDENKLFDQSGFRGGNLKVLDGETSTEISSSEPLGRRIIFPIINKIEVSSPLMNRNFINGYLDVYAEYSIMAEAEYREFEYKRELCRYWADLDRAPRIEEDFDISIKEYSNKFKGSIFVEVKAGKKHIANVIQQISTYRNYFGEYCTPIPVLATLYRLNKIEQRALDREGIKWIWLDEKKIRDYLATEVEQLPF